MRLLLLDDSRVLPWLVRRMVPPGVQVQVTHSFSDALRRISEDPPEAIMVNLPLAKLPWRRFHEMCTGHQPPIPVLYESCTHSGVAEAGVSFQEGYADFLPSPWTAALLRSRIASLIDAADRARRPVPRPAGPGAVLLLSLLVLLLLTPLAAARAADHPRLVRLDATRCTTCHRDLLKNAETVHPPAADDCTTCHSFDIGDEGTKVELVESGTALCLMCHDKEAEAEGTLASPHYPVTESCLSCHDPHATPRERLLIAPQRELCATCHDIDELEEVHGGQLTEATTCTACHAPHGSDNPSMLLAKALHPPFEDGDCTSCHRPPFADRVRLTARGEDLCTACHGEMSEPGDASVHEALHGNRRAGCLSCHDPHMSNQQPLLVAAIPGLCAQCHGDVVEAVRADTGHAVGEECTACHLPHSSAEPHLLTVTPPELCGQCHDIEGEELTTAHLGANLPSLDCTNCHSPHGAGHPKLLARTIHPPVLDGCDLCHQGSSSDLMEDGEADLCYACHGDIEEAVENAPVPHPALELGPCTECHNPHASPQDALVKSPGAGPCLDCHDDKAPEEGEVSHGIIDSVGCRACHEPHGGQNPSLLRTADPVELCLSCHGSRAVDVGPDDTTVTLLGRFEIPAAEARKIPILPLSADGQRNHPVTGHRVLGTPTEEELSRTETTYTGELTCLTCHDPHKGASHGLFAWGATSGLEACQHCHPK